MFELPPYLPNLLHGEQYYSRFQNSFKLIMNKAFQFFSSVSLISRSDKKKHLLALVHHSIPNAEMMHKVKEFCDSPMEKWDDDVLACLLNSSCSSSPFMCSELMLT